MTTAPLIAADEAVERHRLTLYHSWYSPDTMVDILRLNGRTAGHSRLTVLAYAYRLGSGKGSLTWDLEGQLGLHSGRQSHLETNVVLVARWNRFPWDRLIDTSAAFGWGLSYAFDVPEIEPRTDPDEESTRLLNYLLVELDFSPPGDSPWGVVARLHHRSGVFGTFSGVYGGSDFIGLGLRYTF